MEFEAACTLLQMSPEIRFLAARAVEVLLDAEASLSHAQILALHLVDIPSKQIADAVGKEQDAISKVIQRERRRLDVAGKGTLAFFVATHSKFPRWRESGGDENGVVRGDSGLPIPRNSAAPMSGRL